MVGRGGFTDYQKIGLGLLGFGSAFLFIGVLMFFDSGLLALGNILFLAGLGCLIGLRGIFSFFFKGDSYKGSLFFFAGVAVVFIGFPIIGMLIESFGMIKLFRRFMPVIIKYLYGVPVIGWILWLPGVNKVVTMVGGQSNSMV
ncbi:unnamed protein product [Calicophoron daubneyi]|uniref:Vesicle transport protein GOT1B n=1 Tax=Calicophoron daubneyi TaxID=300641 RepID=A0AAV2TNU7_CALDB